MRTLTAITSPNPITSPIMKFYDGFGYKPHIFYSGTCITSRLVMLVCTCITQSRLFIPQAKIETLYLILIP